MDVFQVATKISALGECLKALGTSEGALSSVLTEVIP